MKGNHVINTPFKIGNKTMRNRIVFPPIETRMSSITGDITNDLIDYYEARAKGGCGMVIVENNYIDNLESRSATASSGLYIDHLINQKAKLAETIKDCGSLAVIQLSHAGRQQTAVATGLQCIAPSPIPCDANKRMPRQVTKEEILRIQNDFALAADRAKRAGFHGVELHGGHGYLLSQFMSPGANKRTDEYGGSFENRLRMPMETIKKVRAAVGKEFIVGFRISVDEFLGENGLEPDEACRFTKALEHMLDYVSCSAGTHVTRATGICPPVYEPAGKLVPLAAQMKKAVNIPIIAVGALDFKRAEDTLEKGYADLVALGRQQIADPEFANKVAEGRFDDIRPCCRGNEGCQSADLYPIRCELNPAVGRERKYRMRKTGNPKRIVIVGGGCSGLEAARIADLMGHEVILLEKADHLGGHLNEACIPPHKTKTGEYFAWLVGQVRKGRTKIILNACTSSEEIQSMKPDSVFIAVGSKYIVPPFEGKEHAVYADKALFDQDSIGKSVLVIGGGLVGCETALTLAENKGCEVTIIEMLDGLNKSMNPNARKTMIDRIEKDGIKVLCSHKVMKIIPGGAVCAGPDSDEKTIMAESVVIAIGLQADESNAARYEDLGVQAVRIGDCKSAQTFYTCNEDAWRAVFQLTER